MISSIPDTLSDFEQRVWKSRYKSAEEIILLNDEMLFCDKISYFTMINEVLFIFTGCLPLRALTRFQQRRQIIKPQFCHAVEVCASGVARHMKAMTLHKPPHAWNPRANRAMNMLPVIEEIVVGHPRLLRNAVDKLDHFSTKANYSMR